MEDSGVEGAVGETEASNRNFKTAATAGEVEEDTAADEVHPLFLRYCAYILTQKKIGPVLRWWCFWRFGQRFVRWSTKRRRHWLSRRRWRRWLQLWPSSERFWYASSACRRLLWSSSTTSATCHGRRRLQCVWTKAIVSVGSLVLIPPF